MSFPRFKASKSICRVAEPATSATTATFEAAKEDKDRTKEQKCSNVANVATSASPHFVFDGHYLDDDGCSDFDVYDDPADTPEAVERIETWIRITDGPLPENKSWLWKRYADATKEFALGPWAYAAVESGWDDSSLFAIAYGLVPEMLRRTFRLKAIHANAAMGMNEKGRLELWPCAKKVTAPPWWGDARFETPAQLT